MFPRRSLSVGLVVIFVLSLLVAFGLFLTPSHGYWGYGGCCGCQQTWCVWSETWHAYNALDTPLRPYYIPRTPGYCNREGYALRGNGGGCAAAAAIGACGSSCNYPPQAGMGLDPVRFERLGQIPNDMDLGGLPAPGPRSQ